MALNTEQLKKLSNISIKESISDFDSFEKTLFEDIDRIMRRMESSSDKYFVEKEDDITTEIVGRLYEAGWDNVHEQTKVGGIRKRKHDVVT